MLYLLACAGGGGGEIDGLERAQMEVSTESLDGDGTVTVTNAGEVRLGILPAVAPAIEGGELWFSMEVGPITGGHPPEHDYRVFPIEMEDGGIALDPGASVSLEISVDPGAPEEVWGELAVRSVAEVGVGELAQSAVYADLDNSWRGAWLHGWGSGGSVERPRGAIGSMHLDHTAIEVGGAVATSVYIVDEGVRACPMQGATDVTSGRDGDVMRVSCIVRDDRGNQRWWFGEIQVYPVGYLSAPIVPE